MSQSQPFTDCWDLQTRGGLDKSGVYEIHPIEGSNVSLNVRCDMFTDGGGWTVLQCRCDGSVNFTRSMSEYIDGFGDVSGKHWVGLEWIHALTSQGDVIMRVDLCTFAGQAGYAMFYRFRVSGQNDTYRLRMGNYMSVSSLPNYLGSPDGRTFQATGRCADFHRGGWWYHSCLHTNLNGEPYNGSSGHGIVWWNFGAFYSAPSLRSSEMKVRPINAPRDTSRPYTCPP